MSALGAESVDGVVVVVVSVDDGVVEVGVVGVVVVVDEGVDDAGVVVVVAPGDVGELVVELEEVVVVEVPLDEDDDVVVLSDEDGLVLDEFVSRPLLCSCVSICCCTPATAEATAPGVALAPSCGSALSCLRSAASCAVSSLVGSELSVTTI